MFKFFQYLFRHRKQLEAKLGEFSLKDIANFPQESEAGSAELYIQEYQNDNELIINYHRSKMDTGGVHHITYLPQQSTIIIESLPEKKVFYRYLLLIAIFPILLIVKSNWAFIWIIFLAVRFPFLLFGIRAESAEMKRELTIRVNYVLRTGKKVNVIS